MTALHDRQSDRHGTNRWRVHLALIFSGVLTLVALVVGSGVLLHVVAGLAFTGVVGAHVAQRRRTIGNLTAGLARADGWRTARGRRALSDGVLAFLGANVIISGVIEWIDGRSVMLPLRTLTGIPLPTLNWHTSTSLAFIVYLVVHVVRRRTRLRNSHIQ